MRNVLCTNDRRIDELTPEDVGCITGSNPSIYIETVYKDGGYGTKEGYVEEFYLIIGKVVNPSKVALEGRVKKGDTLIRVPRRLIDPHRI